LRITRTDSIPDCFQELKFLRRLISARHGTAKARAKQSKASPSETLAWWVRAAQARRAARMLSARDTQLAEAYAIECEDQAREASSRWPPIGTFGACAVVRKSNP